MKNLVLFAFLLWSAVAVAQKITINPDYVVGNTKFEVNEINVKTNFEEKHKANIIFDYFGKDTTEVFIGVRGFCIWGLYLKFSKGKVTPIYHFWDDGGGNVTELPFESYELTLSSNNPKKGERLRGRFNGVVTEVKKNGTVVKHHLKGKFTHEMEDTAARIRWQNQIEQENLSKKIYLQTGFYPLMSTDYGMEIKAPTYSHIHTGEEYYLYNSNQRGFELLSQLSKAIVQPDSKNPKIMNVKILFHNSALDYYKDSNGDVITSSVALIVDDVLYMAGAPLTVSNGGMIVPIGSKSKKEAEMVADKLNIAIQKFEKVQKQARRNPVMGG